MNGVDRIARLTKLLCASASMVDMLHAGMGNAWVDDLSEDMLLDELHHVQMITIELTKLIAGSDDNADGDGSVFAEGELNDNLGEKDAEDVKVEEPGEDEE